MSGPPLPIRCPDCGTDLLSEPGMPGLCPQCLLSLALKESPASPREDGSKDSDSQEAATLDRLSAGRILGERYQIRELLGRGGMGEVFRAFDLKLRVDVALKAVRSQSVESERARELLRREVRTAREVVSPNVCRIFDLVAEDGQELVSMEYVDGVTLGEMLRRRGPLPLEEAREIASQFLSGLEAIHQAGLVHRDFKPENVMVTRAGRVVVMDFGLAKLQASGSGGTISGTPAYMSPEQARGDPLDARADVYAAGVVLAEMLAVGGADHVEQRRALWRGVRESPPRVPEGPWSGVLRRALSLLPEDRPGSARELSRALEEVTERLPGFETRRPYPGLASFTEEDAEYFFGREQEVEALFKKLRRPRLLGLVAPSGAGKSSFLRAGLLPALPKGWKAIVTTPGSRPFQALARTLAPAFSGDSDAMDALLRFEEADAAVSLFQRFRQRHEQALLVVDQFEELFTLCPDEVQQRFSSLLSRLVLEADLHVILSLRDDFLYRCHEQESLAPATADLTILSALSESGLRRALVQPALACGYRFEDEALVDEMVGEVQKERGALPLLAFATSRLWEKRDRETGLLTREAYREIGGVAGALAQHAEATLERVGSQRVPIVRELFRNLVTAEGTRAVREREELLSVFGAGDSVQTQLSGSESGRGAGEAVSPEEAQGVLNALLDARLLTSYERAGEAGESHHQVEIVHESLLQAWPRLVRWQTQDADGAQLRDQLRQAAQLWQDRGRPTDLLWSGTAYRDFALWRERYTAPLTASEEAFASATEGNARRRRRRRQAAVVGLVTTAALVGIVTSVLWWRSERARLRAEANSLLVLGEAELERYPTGALAYAMASLELADTEAGRLLALRTLQRAPMARIAPVHGDESEGGGALGLDFSPSGEWVATGGYMKADVLHRDGDYRLALGGFRSKGQRALHVRFSSGSDALMANSKGDLRIWSLPDGRERRRFDGDEGLVGGLLPWNGGALTLTTVGSAEVVRWWPFDDRDPRLVGTMEAVVAAAVSGSELIYSRGSRIFARSLEDWARPPRLLADFPGEVQGLAVHPNGRRLAALAGGELRLWPIDGQATAPERVIAATGTYRPPLFDPTGRWLSASGRVDGRPTVRLADLAAPRGAEPLLLERGDAFTMNQSAFGPAGQWLATGHAADLALWWLGDTRPRVLRGHEGFIEGLVFAPDGQSLLSAGRDGTVRVWPISASTGAEPRVLFRAPLGYPGLAIDPAGKRILVSGAAGRVYLVPLDGGAEKLLEGFSERTDIMAVAFGDGGRLAAAAPYIGPREEKVVRVWDLETGEVRVLGMPGAGDGFVGGVRDPGSLAFVGRDRIVASSNFAGVASFDLATGEATLVAARPNYSAHVSHDQETVIGLQIDGETREDFYRSQLLRLDLDDGSLAPLPDYPQGVKLALDPSDRLIAVGSADGTIRVGPVAGGEPHLLLGHVGWADPVAFSPDGRWLASAGADKTIRLWPVPDVSRTPLHRRPLEELLRVLRTHTNLRAVEDGAAATGYRLEPGPFPGWHTPPESW